MPEEVEEPRPARARRARAVAMALVFLGLTLVLVRERAGEVGIWDWDTYGRLQFIDDYRPDLYVDGHLLYHGVMRAVMAFGLGPLSAVELLTAAGAAAFLVLLWWLCRRAALAPAHTRLVLAAATIGSPGLVELYLMAEDNVLYLPIGLAVFALLARPTSDRRGEIRRGAAIGALIAMAMLINISLLVMLGALAPAPLLWRRDGARALGLAVAGATAAVTYYGAHVVPFGGARNALHQFLPQALALQDFAQSTTPLGSLARFEQYRGGLRAIGLAPSVHLMALGPWVKTLLLGVLPTLLVGLWAAVLVWVVRARAPALRAALWTRLDAAALLAIGLVFPYFYEPILIERWDLFWIGCVFLLVPLLQLRPPRVVVGLLVAIVALQGVGTVIAVANHYHGAWTRPDIAAMRARATAVRVRGERVAVLPATVDRLLLADFVHHAGTPTVFLAAADGTFLRLYDLHEVPVELAEVQRAVAGAQPAVFADPGLAPSVRGALGLAPPPP